MYKGVAGGLRISVLVRLFSRSLQGSKASMIIKIRNFFHILPSHELLLGYHMWSYT